MQKHENKPPQKGVTEKEEYHSTLDMVALKNNIRSETDEIRRKLELGRGMKEIIIKCKIMKASSDKEFAEALKLF